MKMICIVFFVEGGLENTLRVLMRLLEPGNGCFSTWELQGLTKNAKQTQNFEVILKSGFGAGEKEFMELMSGDHQVLNYSTRGRQG